MLATVWCASHEVCLPVTFSTAYGDLATCVDRQAMLCERTRFGPGSTTTADDVRRCADGWAPSSDGLDARCDEWIQRELGRNPPEECRPPVLLGELSEGATCLVHEQCESGVCIRVHECGVCRAADLEARCFEDADCPPASSCRAGQCASFAGLGLSCADQPCQPHLRCNEQKTCSARPGKDDACDADAPNPCKQFPQELTCDRSARGRPGTCQPYVPQRLGEPCAEDGAASICEHASVCRGVLTQAEPPVWRCEPVRDDGASCGTASGSVALSFPHGGPCRAPARCLQDQCQIPSTAGCGAAPLP